MNKCKRIFCRLAMPPVAVGVIITLFCAVSLSYIFSNSLEHSTISYTIYALSAYALLLCIIRSINAAKWIKASIYSHHFGQRYMNDMVLRAHISLHISTAINCIYAVTKLTFAIYYHSSWFVAIAVYYLVLAVMRGLLLRSTYQKSADIKKEYRTSLLCGYLLFALNIALSAITAQMVIDGAGYTYPGTLIFVVALYAFYSVSMSVLSLIHFRKLHSPVLMVSKVLGLAVALVSMLSLQTAMFASFGGTFQFKQLMNTLTGGAVCLLIFIMAIAVVVRARRGLNRCNEFYKARRISNGK